MTASLHEQVPEALRLADEWRRETQREVDRRNSAYDHYGMGNTPETLDPLGAKMAAELRRQHAENEALRAGYNAARLEIESLKPQIIPGVQWQCGPLASGFTAPHPAALTLVASSQPAPDEIINMAREQGLPETEIEGVFRVNADDLCRVAAAILVARAPADRVTAPQQEAQEPVMIYHGDCTIDCGEHGHHHVELLRMIPAGSKLYAAPQPSPASQGDAARRFFDAGWKACANFCDRDDVRFDGIVGHRGCPQFEEAFRAARKQGGV